MMNFAECGASCTNHICCAHSRYHFWLMMCITLYVLRDKGFRITNIMEGEMSTAALTNFNFDVRDRGKAPNGKETHSLELYALANEAQKMAKDVEQNWSTFDQEKKGRYKALAYHITNTKPSLRKRVAFRLKTWSASDDSLMQSRFAVWNLLNTIFDKVEEENGSFQAKMGQIIDEFDPDEDGMLVTRGDAIERLRELSG